MVKKSPELLTPPHKLHLGYHWASIGPTMAICAAHLVDPAHPARFFGVPRHSGLDFFIFFIDVDTLRTLEIIGKPKENLGFSMVFMNSARLLQSR